MKKFKFGASFLLVVLISAFAQKFLLLINYLLALTLHELAHMFVATKRGYTIKEFKLNMFGVSIELNEKINDKDSFAINIAGPVFNLFLCLVCVALYWIFPLSFTVLNTFCMSNLILAIFNLLPVYPLDGGKVFSSFMSDKFYKKFDKVVNLVLGIVSIAFFIFSCLKNINWYWLILGIFFLTTKSNKETKLSLFKYSKNKQIQKVNMLKISGTETLFELLKKIDSKHYTIFYYNNSQPNYIDEDDIIHLSTIHPLITKLEEIEK